MTLSGTTSPGTIRKFVSKIHGPITILRFSTAARKPIMCFCLIPVDWEYSIPYGILYAREPSEEVRRFLAAVQDRIPETEREG